MPYSPSKLKQLDAMLDEFLANHRKDQEERTKVNALKDAIIGDDEDDCDDILNPLSAPKQPYGFGDGEGAGGPPKLIHGEGED